MRSDGPLCRGVALKAAKRKPAMPRKKKTVSAKRLKELQERISAQRRRALRPTLPVNTQARVSESLVEKKRKLEKKRRQRRDWEDL